MRFSIIVPTYNERDWIRNCLMSIREQDFPRGEFEIIVSDASSPDGTADRAREFSDTVVTSTTRGIAHGRNVGAKQAQGEILVFVDADATLSRDFLREFDEAFRADDVVGVTGIGIPADGRAVHRAVYRATYILVRLFDIFGLPLYPGICVGYRKVTFDAIGGFREDFGVAEDLDLSKRISSSGKCLVKTTATSFVSTRRIQKHLVSTILFHVYSDLRYLLTGQAAKRYPKMEELHSPRDLWRMNRS